MLVNRLTVGVTLCALVCAAGAVRAQQAVSGLQPLAAVRAAAVRGVQRALDPKLAGVQLEAAPLDPRLRLTACPAALDAHALAPRGAQARVLVRVACASGAYWSINVPVDIRRTQSVLVLRRAVARGESIAAGDVTVESRVLPGLASPYVARAEDLAGRITRRGLPEGTAVSADALTAALLIHRGQSVTLAAATGGIEVRAPGRALADATARQRVRVQNLASLKVVEGVAESDGVVRVNP